MINILVALILLIIAIIQFEGSGQLLDQLWQFESFILVFWGTLTATVLQFSLQPQRFGLPSQSREPSRTRSHR